MRWDDTSQKLLGVYQPLYINADRELARFPERLSPKGLIRCRSGIAGWVRPLGWGWPAGTGDAGRRRRAEPASGHKTGLQLLIRLVTGQPCEVVERFQ